MRHLQPLPLGSENSLINYQIKLPNRLAPHQISDRIYTCSIRSCPPLPPPLIHYLLPSRRAMQQRPTCTNVRIRSTRDAHKIFYAVQRRVLPMITRRLDADERLALRSGCVYAWEERGPHTEITGLGIERFTEGRRWSPSRVRDVRPHFVTIDT